LEALVGLLATLKPSLLASRAIQIIVNYAAFLEENKYFEESFKVYERGVELFSFPIAFEIWNIYLAKFVERYVGRPLPAPRVRPVLSSDR
jgi:hypothetical protein